MSMSRDRTGRSFTDATIEAVWQKGTIVPGTDGRQLRKDRCGAWIARHEYGMTTNVGWEVDHDMSVSKGGTDELRNLRPLHWENNRSKGDDWPRWSCAVRAA